MAEIEFAGLKLRGGKIVALVMGLSTLGGGAYGVFEAYARYQAMTEKIDSYVAPDLTSIHQQLALVSQELDAVRLRVGEIQDITRDMREEARADAAGLHEAMTGVERRTRLMDGETREAMRTAEQVLRSIISSAQERFDARISSVDDKLDAQDKRLRAMVQRALDNPLLKDK